MCPKCKGKSQEVKEITVRNFVIDGLKEDITKGSYHVCLNSDCDVVYFRLDNEMIIKNNDIKIPVWFKKGSSPKYICYCSKVTEDEIINAVLNQGARNVKDVVKITGAMKNANCELNNPLGKCCSASIQEVINKTIDSKITNN